MSSIFIYHYVYRITNLVENKHYYGKRSSKNLTPKEDLGKRYFSSSFDEYFIEDQKSNPQNYKYKVVRCFPNAKDAVLFEAKIHEKFDVARNKSFYNKAKCTGRGFDRTGCVGGFSGKTHNADSRAKIGAAGRGNKYNTGRKLTCEHKNKISKALVGYNHSEQSKAAYKEAAIKRSQDPEYRIKSSMSAKKRGIPKVSCIVCKKTVGVPLFRKYHEKCHYEVTIGNTSPHDPVREPLA